MNDEKATLPVSEVPRAKWYSRRWVVVVLALVLFVSGALVGGGVTVVFVVRQARHAARHPDEAQRRMLERMVSTLDLTPEKKERVDAVIARRVDAMRAMRREFQPRVRREIETTAQEVEGELTPEQALRWRAMVNRLKNNWMPPQEGDQTPARRIKGN